MKIRQNDNVIVISGAYKGTHGKVAKALPSKNMVVVEGVNKKTKHVKPTQQQTEGSIKTIYAPIHVSNVAIEDPKTKEPTKITYKIVDNKKVRVTKKSGSILD